MRRCCNVTRVLTNAQGTKVTGVEYYDQKKERQVQEANVVVLAAWAATESAPAAQFGDRQAPKGLANANGLVGKYMMTHFDRGHQRRSSTKNVENHMGTIGAQYMSYERYGKTAIRSVRQLLHRLAGAALKDQRPTFRQYPP